MITAERDQPEIDFAVPMIDIDPPPRATPRASRGRGRPGVCPTPGITAAGRARGGAITTRGGGRNGRSVACGPGQVRLRAGAIDAHHQTVRERAVPPFSRPHARPNEPGRPF